MDNQAKLRPAPIYSLRSIDHRITSTKDLGDVRALRKGFDDNVTGASGAQPTVGQAISGKLSRCQPSRHQ